MRCPSQRGMLLLSCLIALSFQMTTNPPISVFSPRFSPLPLRLDSFSPLPLRLDSFSPGPLCESNADCMLPKVCCDGPWFHYCCDIGALVERMRRRNVSYVPA